jgi:Fe-S cluster assembly iron-binding protein IscA
MDLHLSPAAREAARRDLDPRQVLRIAFAGGCGAMGFRLSATRRGDEDDLRLELGPVTVLLDRMAARELDGATLDYQEDQGFVLDHPRWGVSC